MASSSSVVRFDSTIGKVTPHHIRRRFLSVFICGHFAFDFRVTSIFINTVNNLAVRPLASRGIYEMGTARHANTKNTKRTQSAKYRAAVPTPIGFGFFRIVISRVHSQEYPFLSAVYATIPHPSQPQMGSFFSNLKISPSHCPPSCQPNPPSGATSAFLVKIEDSRHVAQVPKRRARPYWPNAWCATLYGSPDSAYPSRLTQYNTSSGAGSRDLDAAVA